LAQWNETAVEYPRDKCIHELFEEQAGRTPAQIAVVFEEEEISYRELNERANQLAHYLRQLGVGPEGRVGFCVGLSVEMVVALLGILKAGGAYVPLEPEYPLDRLSFMIEDASVLVLLTQEHLLEKLPAQYLQVLCLDTEWEMVAEHSTAAVETKVAAENLAYVMYTSGSTGQPK